MNVLVVTNTDPVKINHIVDSFGESENLTVTVLNQYNIAHRASLTERILYKLKIPMDTDKLNQRIIKSIDKATPDIIFIIKGNIVYPTILKRIKKLYPKIKLISWSLDDMYAWHNRSIYYTFGIKFYDVVFTTKSYNLNELKKLGAKNIKFLYQAYSKKYHIPYSDCCKTKFKFDVLFIGTAEKERIESLNFLAKNGIKIQIYGGGWDKVNPALIHPNLTLNKYDLIGDDYAEALSCAKVSLCFLRKINRDLHTSRSIEIPACKGFMIAERTQEHLDLFEEDKEAVYFDNNEELLEKVQYYLKHENLRKQISENGYKRCLTSGYSYDNMVSKILKVLDSEV